jgi:hypothetical protein
VILDLCLPLGHFPKLFERCSLADRRIAPGLGVAAGHPVQPAGELCIRKIQMLGSVQEMQIGSVVDDEAQPAMPMAPSRLRMCANSPLADFTPGCCSGAADSRGALRCVRAA